MVGCQNVSILWCFDSFDINASRAPNTVKSTPRCWWCLNPPPSWRGLWRSSRPWCSSTSSSCSKYKLNTWDDSGGKVTWRPCRPSTRRSDIGSTMTGHTETVSYKLGRVLKCIRRHLFLLSFTPPTPLVWSRPGCSSLGLPGRGMRSAGQHRALQQPPLRQEPQQPGLSACGQLPAERSGAARGPARGLPDELRPVAGTRGLLQAYFLGRTATVRMHSS